ncbi:MAG: Uma2 family endonuclease [Polyangiaceae bacterium]
MADAAKRNATYADVLNAPENRVAEILDGELTLSPRPALGHASAASALGEELGPPFKRGKGGPGGWIILGEPELRLGDNVLVPDLAGWRKERLPHVRATQPSVSIAPDWLCEVLSPGTARADRGIKLPIYAREGVRHVWLVDPLERLLEVLRLENGRWSIVAVHQQDERIRAEPFEAIELDLSVLWADVLLEGEER